MLYKNEDDLWNNGAVICDQAAIKIIDVAVLREKVVDNLVDTIIVTDDLRLRNLCYWLTHACAVLLDVYPASIDGLYAAMGRGDIGGFTVPAINMRTLTFDLTRAAFRAAKRINAGAFIFEIAKSEIGYTHQEPLEYSSIIMLAAIKEDYRGPVFIQGDHFQLNAGRYRSDCQKEITPLEALIKKAIDGQFYNIDIDASTLVDLSKNSVDDQQKLNYEISGYFTNFIRSCQPPGIEISIGGEIGEVGGKNSTPEELKAFMHGYQKQIKANKGISKISVQTGTSHGGVVLPDGSMAEVKIDFKTLKELSDISRSCFNMAGAVQHGASTLPNEAFHHFPQAHCAEIHLATQFQNIIYDYMPLALKEKIYAWLHIECIEEKTNGWTDDQFIYKTRKKALGPFKREIHSLPGDIRQRIATFMEDEFNFLFEQLGIENTGDYVQKYTAPVIIKRKKEDFLKTI